MKTFLFIILGIVVAVVVLIAALVISEIIRIKKNKKENEIAWQKRKEEHELAKQKSDAAKIERMKEVKVLTIPNDTDYRDYVRMKTANYFKLVDKCSFLTKMGCEVNTTEILTSFFDKITFPQGSTIECYQDGTEAYHRNIIALNIEGKKVTSDDILNEVKVTFDEQGVWQAILLTLQFDEGHMSSFSIITENGDVEAFLKSSDPDEISDDIQEYMHRRELLPSMLLRDDQAMLFYYIWVYNMNEANHLIKRGRVAKKHGESIVFVDEYEVNKEVLALSQNMHLNIEFFD